MNADRWRGLDCADDIALLESTWRKGMKDLIRRTQKEAFKFGLRVNPTKKIMTKVDRTMIDDREVGPIDDFCYLGSLITADSNRYKKVKMRIGKVNVAFRRLERMRNNKRWSMKAKIRLDMTP